MNGLFTIIGTILGSVIAGIFQIITYKFSKKREKDKIRFSLYEQALEHAKIRAKIAMYQTFDMDETVVEKLRKYLDEEAEIYNHFFAQLSYEMPAETVHDYQNLLAQIDSGEVGITSVPPRVFDIFKKGETKKGDCKKNAKKGTKSSSH